MANRQATPAKRRGRGILPETEPKPVKVSAPKEETRRKRVYTSVAVVEAGGVFGVSLDGRALHTPGRAKLETSSKALAEAIREEWDAQHEYIDPQTMVQTKLLNTALDRIAPDADAVVSNLLNYFESDLLCYWADGPESLCQRQAAVWQPVLDWMAQTHRINLKVGKGLMPVSQSDEDRARAEQVLCDCDTIKLTAVQAAAGLTSSLSLSLALAHGHLNAEELTAAAQLDETWQMEKWGDDQESLTRMAHLATEVAAVERFLKLNAM